MGIIYIPHAKGIDLCVTGEYIAYSNKEATMDLKEEFIKTKAVLEDTSAEFRRLTDKLGDLQDDLQNLCEELYGHDYGDGDMLCHNCSKADIHLFEEAESFV